MRVVAHVQGENLREIRVADKNQVIGIRAEIVFRFRDIVYIARQFGFENFRVRNGQIRPLQS